MRRTAWLVIAVVLGVAATPRRAAAGPWAVDLGGGVEHVYANHAFGGNHLASVVPVKVGVRRALANGWQLGGGVQLGWLRSGARGEDLIMTGRAVVGGGWRGARMRSALGVGVLMLGPSPVGADGHLGADRGVVLAGAVARSLWRGSRWSVTVEVAPAFFAAGGRVYTTGVSLTWSSR